MVWFPVDFRVDYFPAQVVLTAFLPACFQRFHYYHFLAWSRACFPELNYSAELPDGCLPTDFHCYHCPAD